MWLRLLDYRANQLLTFLKSGNFQLFITVTREFGLERWGGVVLSNGLIQVGLLALNLGALALGKTNLSSPILSLSFLPPKMKTHAYTTFH